MIQYTTVKVFSSGNAVRVQPEGIAPGQSYSSGNFIIIPEKISSPAAAHGFIEFKSNAPGIDSFRVHSSGIQNSGGTVLGANQAAVQTALDSLFFLTSGGGGGATELDDLSDVAITTPTTGQVIKYNGTQWVNDTDSTGGGGLVAEDIDTLAELNAILTDATLVDESDIVLLTGSQTVEGVKTFSDIPVLPGSNPTTDNQAVRKLYADTVAKQSLIIPFSDEATTDITSGTAKITFYMPYAMTLTEIPFLSFTTAPTGSGATIDINEADVSILSTKLTSNTGVLTSTGATPAVLSDTSLANKAKITIDVDAIGTGARGGKVILVGIVTV